MDEGGGLEVSVEPREDAAIVRVVGELDVSTRPVLASVLDDVLAQPAPSLVLDLGGVRFADASAVALFVGATTRARTLGGQVRVRNVTPLLARIFSITRVETVLDIEAFDGTR